MNFIIALFLGSFLFMMYNTFKSVEQLNDLKDEMLSLKKKLAN